MKVILLTYKGGSKMKTKKEAFYIGILFAISTFILFYVGVHFALKQEITFENYIAYFVFSMLIGLIVTIFAHMKQKVGLIIFTVFYVIGFGMMIYSFSADLTGWEDLAGLLQMMLILAAGTTLASLTQLGLYLVNRSKNK